MPDFHPQDWNIIVEALAVYNQWQDQDDTHAELVCQMQREITAEHGFEQPREFIRQASDTMFDSEVS